MIVETPIYCDGVEVGKLRSSSQHPDRPQIQYRSIYDKGFNTPSSAIQELMAVAQHGFTSRLALDGVVKRIDITVQ